MGTRWKPGAYVLEVSGAPGVERESSETDGEAVSRVGMLELGARPA